MGDKENTSRARSDGKELNLEKNLLEKEPKLLKTRIWMKNWLNYLTHMTKQNISKIPPVQGKKLDGKELNLEKNLLEKEAEVTENENMDEKLAELLDAHDEAEYFQNTSSTNVIDEEFFQEFFQQSREPNEARKDAFYCRSKEMITTVLNAADRRNDEKAQEVRLRLSGIGNLVAANGVYHLDCYQQFVFHKPPGEGRKCELPEANYIVKAMEEIHFLIEKISGTIKRKLKDKYGERIIIAVRKSWYDDRKADESVERQRIIQAAAKIIRQDVQKNLCDTNAYPPGNNFIKQATSCVPPTLRVFLETLIMKKANNGILFSASVQHKDFGGTREARDAADTAKLQRWFESCPLFPVTDDIVPIISGLVGENKVKCYNASEIGIRAITKIVGQHFSEVKLSLKDRAFSLESIPNSVRAFG
ncbi:hypothetical protein JTB14_010264 [Gonioctena quinquepunctata]|nr:hypothetical protein JTB14_010264 [Gonioctena quinquepunctata]